MRSAVFESAGSKPTVLGIDVERHDETLFPKRLVECTRTAHFQDLQAGDAGTAIGHLRGSDGPRQSAIIKIRRSCIDVALPS